MLALQGQVRRLSSSLRFHVIWRSPAELTSMASGGPPLPPPPPAQSSEAPPDIDGSANGAPPPSNGSGGGGSGDIREGQAHIRVSNASDVFYNPAQVVNRDLSLAVLRVFFRRCKAEVSDPSGRSSKRRQRLDGPPPGAPFHFQIDSIRGPRILEGLAATGLRALRYALELPLSASAAVAVSDAEEMQPGVVVANDLDPAAVEAIRRNAKDNSVPSQVDEILAKHATDANPDISSFGGLIATESDARMLMLTHPKAFDVIDLDPYGTPSQLLEPAVEAVADGGLLCVTATDTAVLCGNNSEVCWAKYGSMPLRGDFCHEYALRMLLQTVSAAAAKQRKQIVPILSVSIDFYIRIFVRVFSSPRETKDLPLKLAYVCQSTGCKSFYLQPVGKASTKDDGIVKRKPGFHKSPPPGCNQADSQVLMGGPIWANDIHEMEWVKEILAEIRNNPSRYPCGDRVAAVLTAVSEELSDVPLFFTTSSLCAIVKASAPNSTLFKSAIINAGYRVSGTHCNPAGIKTDCPFDIVWDIMRCWIESHPVKPPVEGSIAWKILKKPAVHKANFARAKGSMSQAKINGLARFLPNPEENWGPKARAGKRNKMHLQGIGAQIKSAHIENEDSKRAKVEKEQEHAEQTKEARDLSAEKKPEDV